MWKQIIIYNARKKFSERKNLLLVLFACFVNRLTQPSIPSNLFHHRAHEKTIRDVWMRSVKIIQHFPLIFTLSPKLLIFFSSSHPPWAQPPLAISASFPSKAWCEWTPERILYLRRYIFSPLLCNAERKTSISAAIRRSWKLRSSVSSMKNGITSCSRIVLMGKGKGVEERWEIKEKIETFFFFLRSRFILLFFIMLRGAEFLLARGRLRREYLICELLSSPLIRNLGSNFWDENLFLKRSLSRLVSRHFLSRILPLSTKADETNYW